MTVGEFARRAGLRASAVRYYERLGLLPPPPRRNGRRVYGPEAFAHLAVVRLRASAASRWRKRGGFFAGSLRRRRHRLAGAPWRNRSSRRWTRSSRVLRR